MSWVLTAFLLGHAGLSPARTVSSGAGPSRAELRAGSRDPSDS